MTVHNPTHRDMKKSLIYMEQMSWDDTLEILARLPLTINAVSGAPEKQTGIQGNASFSLSYDGDGNLTTLDKIISGVTYRKTFTWTGGKLTAISTWSIV